MAVNSNELIGLAAPSMRAVLEALRADADLRLEKVDVRYAMAHPTKRMPDPEARITVSVEPAGWSQTMSVLDLALNHYFWIKVVFKPDEMELEGDEDALFRVGEKITLLLHKKVMGALTTYFSKISILYRNTTLITDTRRTFMELKDGEIGAVLFFWQSPYTAETLASSYERFRLKEPKILQVQQITSSSPGWSGSVVEDPQEELAAAKVADAITDGFAGV